MPLHSEKTPLDFNALAVALEDSNLIEASAGTGKTYSIAILVLRLLLRHFSPDYRSQQALREEKRIFVGEILMVTFTNAAVAELENRIRKFVKEAFNYADSLAHGQQPMGDRDDPVASVVHQAIANSSEEAVAEALKENLLLLDEANISTIHGFCQRVLSEFALETNQLFGVEIFTDTDKVIENELNKFWRKYVTTLDPEILLQLGDLDAFRYDIQSVVKAHLDGKAYWAYDENVDYAAEDSNRLLRDKLTALEAERAERLEALHSLLGSADLRALVDGTGAQKRSREAFYGVLDDIPAFLDVYAADATKVSKAFPEPYKCQIDSYLSDYRVVNGRMYVSLTQWLYCLAIQKIAEGYARFLLQANSVTYGDLITKLHEAVEGPFAERLRENLARQYKAVFVDEFQDTDRMQYDIFHRVFGTGSILFLIGDPKQSIYAWRKADMATYFLARNQVAHLYSMNTNYRSSRPAIDAMNHFFLPEAGFDTFCFVNDSDGIYYQQVLSPEKNTKGTLYYQQSPCRGITLLQEKNKKDVPAATGELVLALLTDPSYTLFVNGNYNRIRPEDMGILVRTNKEAVDIKSVLSERGIPSIVIDESKVLTTAEASDVLFLLQAILQPSFPQINRVLLSGLLGYSYKDLALVDGDVLVGLFQEIQAIWQKSGVYPALHRFMVLFDLENRLLTRPMGERKLTNVQQLTELLNQMEQRKKLSQEELVSWLQRGTEGLEHSGDEYEMRIESDESAVQIVTIHKSKGLEYNIAIAPFLDLGIPSAGRLVQFHEPVTQRYVTKERALLTMEENAVYEREQEQENRRLIYVAITRAVSHCFVFKTGTKNSSLVPFFTALSKNDGNMVALATEPVQPSEKHYISGERSITAPPLEAGKFQLLDEDWHKLSFSGLTYHGEYIPKPRTSLFPDTYDQFVFDQLRFGAASGNLLHAILEKLDFRHLDDRDKVRQLVTDALRQYWSASVEDDLLDNLLELLGHIVHAPIRIGNQEISLHEIAYSKRRSELEFDFPLYDFPYGELRFLGGDKAPLQVRSFDTRTVQGLMNGKIDLFFEYKGRYYILDWKSNYLGYRLEDYDTDGVAAAMKENNYHLQYLIYTLAVKKMLETTLPTFDYERHFGGVVYLFLRGIRKDRPTGIFTARPSLEKMKRLEALMGEPVQG